MNLVERAKGLIPEEFKERLPDTLPGPGKLVRPMILD